MSRKWIDEFHAEVKKKPKQFCKKIHSTCMMIDKLFARKDIEYKETDPLAFEEMARIFKHWKGIRKTIKLDIVQKWIVACVLGIKIQNKDGEWVRYFKECRVFIAKKWGKTVLMALFAIWFLLFDRDNEGSEIYCVATKKSQSKLIFDNICVYLKQDKDISKIAKRQYADGTHYISYQEKNGMIKYLSASKKGLQGTNATCCLFDEAQEVDDLTIIEAVRTGMATRKQPMLITMSTAGVTPNSAYQHMYSQIEVMIENKKFDDKARVFFAVFELDTEDLHSSKETWIKSNPALPDGRPTLEHLEKEYSLALMGAEQKSLPSFIAFHLNRSCSDAQTYFTIDELKQGVITVVNEDYRGMYAWAGVDLAQTTDLCNVTVLIAKQCNENENIFEYLFLQRYFMARNRLERNTDTDKVIYSQFLKTKSQDEVCEQLLYLSDGDSVNFDDVTKFFIELRDNHGLIFRKIGYDPAMSAQWVFSMADAGFTKEKRTHSHDGKLTMRDDGQLTEVRQGKYLSQCIREMKAMLEAKRIRFDKYNLLFPMCLSNCKVSVDKDNLYSVEKRKSTGRIDGAVGAFISLMAWNCDKQQFLAEALPYEDWRNKF